MFSRSIAHCSRRHTCVKEEHGIRGLNEIDRLSARTYIPPNLSCFYMPRHDRFLFIIEGTSQENYWISVPRLQWNSRPHVSIPPLPFLSNGRIREKFAYPRLRSGNIAVDHGVCFECFALSGFAAFFFFLHGEETFQKYGKIWFLFLASFIVNCEWNFFVSSRDEKYRWIWKRILNDGVWRC